MEPKHHATPWVNRVCITRSDARTVQPQWTSLRSRGAERCGSGVYVSMDRVCVYGLCVWCAYVCVYVCVCECV